MMNKYVNRRNVIGLIAGLVLLLVFCMLKHPVLAIFIAAMTVTIVWLPEGKNFDWMKVALATVLTVLVICAIMLTGAIRSSITQYMPNLFWIWPICGAAIALIIGIYWMRRNYYEDYVDAEDDEEEGEPIVSGVVIDLTHHTKDEPETVDVYSDKASGKVLITFNKSRWFLEKGKDKLMKESEGRYIIALQDGSKLIIPPAQSVKAVLQ